jgi:hypothetical protein
MALIDKTRILTPEQEQEAHLNKERKAAQARINGQLSHGPNTPLGKAKSSRNAIRHGLTANQHTLLTTEFPDEYEEVREAFIDDLRPATKAELRLVEKIANLDWRLERLVMMETCVLNLEAGVHCEAIAARFERIDGIGFIVQAWRQDASTSHCLDLLRRYMSTLQHQFNTTLSNFRNFEKARLARTRGGRDLDEEAYQAPTFESHIASSIDEPHPLSPPSTPQLPNEPTQPIRINEFASNPRGREPDPKDPNKPRRAA